MCSDSPALPAEANYAKKFAVGTLILSILFGFDLFGFIGSVLVVCCAPQFPEEGPCKFTAAGVLLIFTGILHLIVGVVVLFTLATIFPIAWLLVVLAILEGAVKIHGGRLCLLAQKAMLQAALKRGKAVPQYSAYSEEEDGQYYDEEQPAPSIPVTVTTDAAVLGVSVETPGKRTEEEVLVGGYKVGDTLFYTGESQTFPSGTKLVHGQQGKVTGRGDGEMKHTHLTVLFPGNKRSVGLRPTDVSRELLLPSGYQVGDTVFYTAESQTFPSGTKMVHGQQGKVTGPGTGDRKHTHMKVLFSGNSKSVGCPITDVSREPPEGSDIEESAPKIALTASEIVSDSD